MTASKAGLFLPLDKEVLAVGNTSALFSGKYFCISEEIKEVTKTKMVRNTNTVPIPINIRFMPSEIILSVSTFPFQLSK
jgi:hypothetical protein